MIITRGQSKGVLEKLSFHGRARYPILSSTPQSNSGLIAEANSTEQLSKINCFGTHLIRENQGADFSACSNVIQAG